MTEIAATKGNLVAYLNTNKEADDDRPAFVGRLQTPGLPGERQFALWPTLSAKTGQTLMSGRASEDAVSQIDKIANPGKAIDPDVAISVAQKEGSAGLTIEPHSMLLFSNQQKSAENPNRPDYWGYFNPGAGKPLMRVAVWARTDMRGKPMLTGSFEPEGLSKVKAIDIPRAAPAPRKRRSMSM